MNKTTFGMGCVTACLAGFAWYRGGFGMVMDGVSLGLITFVRVLPILIFAMTAAGLIQVVVSKKVIKRWLGRESGLKGIVIASLGGALIPGGPYGYYPIVASLLASGADISTVMAFSMAKSLWDLGRLPMEIALLGPRTTFIRYSITFAFPIIIGFSSYILFRNCGERVKGWILEHTLTLEKD
ncbi:MAG: hypothetical protein PWQ82_1730 [Thermosediminibacterales bacterium]|nr:hypothetical protein [Thermosediminibacterales bacterium]MDK2836246.1 hypothetical protein [Thermosediminibacterales bacterium]